MGLRQSRSSAGADADGVATPAPVTPAAPVRRAPAWRWMPTLRERPRRAAGLRPGLLEVLHVLDAMPPPSRERRDVVVQAGRLALAALGRDAARSLPGLLAAAAEARETLALDARLARLLEDYVSTGYVEETVHEAVTLISAGAGADTRCPRRGRAALHLAAQGGLQAACRACLRHGADASAVDAEGSTPLHFAAAWGHEHLFGMLLGAGAGLLEARDAQGRTPLFRAVQDDQPAAFEALLSAGASWRTADAGGRGLLHAAAADWEDSDPLTAVGLAARLLDLGADANARDVKGTPPLSYAAAANFVQAAALLLDRGAALEAADADGERALHYGPRSGCADVVLLCLNRGAKIDARCRRGRTALHCAAEADDADTLTALLEHGARQVPDADGDYPLHVAARRDNVNALALLISHGAQVDATGAGGATALRLVAGSRSGCIAAELLLSWGAAAGAADARTGITALHLAAEQGNTTTLRLLADRHGTPVDAAAANGRTPLHYACAANRAAAVEVLLLLGARLQVQDVGGLTPLDLACTEGSTAALASLFLFCGRRAEVQARAGPRAQAAAKTRAHMANGWLQGCRRGGRAAPLHLAAGNSRVDTALLLLQYGARVGALDGSGKTALSRATEGGFEAMAALLRDWGA